MATGGRALCLNSLQLVALDVSGSVAVALLNSEQDCVVMVFLGPFLPSCCAIAKWKELRTGRCSSVSLWTYMHSTVAYLCESTHFSREEGIVGSPLPVCSGLVVSY